MHPAFDPMRIKTIEQRTDDLRESVAEMQRQRDSVKRQRLLLRSTAARAIEGIHATIQRSLAETTYS